MTCTTVVPGARELTLICIHTQPKFANKEIDHLYEVHQHVSSIPSFQRKCTIPQVKKWKALNKKLRFWIYSF